MDVKILYSLRKVVTTPKKESNKCDLWKTLLIVEGRSTTEEELPVKDLGSLIHGELVRLVSPKWKFMYITGGKMSSDDL